MADVVIVGGGIIGCATAYFLAREGASVVVLERGEVAGEASGAAAGMLAALSGESGDQSPEFDALCLRSQAAYETLLPVLAESGVDMRNTRTGVLHVALNEDEAATLRDQFAGQAEAIWLDHDALLQNEPQITSRAVAGYVTSDEQYVDPQRLTQAFAAAARNLGVTIEANAPVTRFRRVRDRITSVTTPTGTYEGDTILLAAGPWTMALAERLGARIPVRPVRGQMLSLNGPPEPLRHMIWGERAYMVPREDGQTYIGATVEEMGYRKRTTTTGIAGLRRHAAELVPSLASAIQRRAWAGLRPASVDGLPVMGPLPGWSNTWVSTGHFRNGILLAAISGELVASSILAGVPDASLAPFSAYRFLD